MLRGGSECGAALYASDSVVVGHRVRRNGWLGTGVALILLGTAIAAMLISNSSSGISINQYLPSRVLLLIAEYSPGSGGGALAEIISRARAGTLSNSQIDAAIGTGLAVQRNTSKPWDCTWGDLVEYERASGKVSNTDWIRYVRQAGAGAFGLTVRPRVRFGDPLPYRISNVPVRGATQSALRLGVGVNLSETTDSTIPYNVTLGLQKTNASGWTGSCIEPEQYPKDFALGNRRVHAHSSIVLGYYPHQQYLLPPGSEFADVTAPVQVLPANQPTVRAVPNPLVASAIHDAISADWFVDGGGQPLSNCNIQFGYSSVPLSFNIYAVVNGKEQLVGSYATPPVTQRRGVTLCDDRILKACTTSPGHYLSHCTLILRADPNPAIKSVDVFDYWDGTIVLKDVPIKIE